MKHTPAKLAKTGKVVKKRTLKISQQLVDEFVNEGIPLTEPGFGDLEADTQRAIEESLKDAHGAHRGPLPPVVFRETDTGKFQPLLEVEGKGKEKVSALSKVNPPPGLYHNLSKSKQPPPVFPSNKEVPPVVKSGALDEGQAGPNPDAEATDATSQPQPRQMDKEFTATAYPNIQENLKLTVDDSVIPKEPASSTGTLSSLQHLAKDFIFGDQFFNDKPLEANNEKTTPDTEAESMLSITIHQDTTAIPPMTSLVIDLVSVPDSPTMHRPLPTTTTAIATTTTTIMTTIPLPPQPQQVREIRIIPIIMSMLVDEIVTDAVEWAMHAPLRERFRDLPEADMKEILHNRMRESKSYQTHEDHMTLYEALEKSIAQDNRDQLLSDLAEARKKKKKRHGSHKTPPGSLPHPQPHPPPPAGPSGTSGASGASGSSQSQPPPPPLSNNQGDEQAYSSSGEDVGRDHIPTVNLRQN
ncbi:hypothetical protein Tco_0808461 [Tanacetum coccineum]